MMLTPPFHRAVNIRWDDSTTAYTICTGTLCRAPLEQCKWFQAMWLCWIRNKRRTRTVWVWRRRTVVHGCREFVKCNRMHIETLWWCSDEEVRRLWCLRCCWIILVGSGSWMETPSTDFDRASHDENRTRRDNNIAQLASLDLSQEICMLMQTVHKNRSTQYQNAVHSVWIGRCMIFSSVLWIVLAKHSQFIKHKHKHKTLTSFQ